MTTVQRRKLLAMVLVLALGLQLGLLGRALAQDGSGGIGIFPVVIEVEDALRGAEYLRTFTVINREPVDLNLRLSADGEISDWLSVHPSPDDLDTTLNEVVVPAESEARLILRMLVPDDAANGPHSGGVIFQGEPANAEDGESGVGVSIGIAADVAITVTGEQNLSGAVLDVSIDDAEVDQPPVRLRVQFENDGNVQATPHINWQIKDPSGAEVGTVAYDDTVVQPGFVENLVVEWDPTGQPEGAYGSIVQLSLGDQIIDERELSFDLLPVGTLTRSGEFENLYLEGEPEPGTVGKLVAVFRNTGKIDTRATFSAEVSFDGQLIDVVESQELVVEVGETAFLEGFFDVGEAGNYRAVGKVLFEGKETDSRTIDFEIIPIASASEPQQESAVVAPDPAPVEAAESATTAGGFSPVWGVAIGVVGVVFAILAGVLLWRSRRAGARSADLEARQQIEGSELQRP